ncbi:MAG: membrane protein insertase YidC [Desulfuromonadaceae bacterium]|nr:membrane protein insertase YidC [Desulfuromonas sp.]MDY0184918.1 membrane protein insertase YidC [Desulfuromonadaceae bacterium]
MENKNTILALLLMLLVWTGFTFLFPSHEEREGGKTQVTAVSSDSAESVDARKTQTTGNNNRQTESFSEVSSDTFKVREEDKFVAFTNDVYSITFNLRGGVVSSIELLDYLQENFSDSLPVALLDNKHDISTLGLFSGGGFGLRGDESYSFTQHNKGSSQVVVLSTALDNGIMLSKTLTFWPDTYLINVHVELENTGNMVLSDALQLKLNNYWHDDLAGNRFDYLGFTSYVDGKLHEDEIKDIQSAKKTYTGDISWSGYTDKYFLSALVNSDNVFDSVLLERNGERISNTVRVSDLSIAPGAKESFNFDVYLGPKNIDYLGASGKKLTEVVDFGFFAFLSKPLHMCLKFFYTFIHNYGIAIIILTVIIKLLFWPLTQKSYTSMRAMQTLQPEMKKLREKFRGDKEGLNRSMMELYKEHRVNPLGGCLPMLVQIPVFIALYKVLLGTIELRHAPFAFWLTDLSVKDPYYITPIIMGATMFIQQKMTPSTMDPMQAKMMLAMPVVFTFIFLNFPSGLVLYWLVNNLLTILQQYLIYRKPVSVKG